MDCPTCHHRTSPTANFCEHCGAPLAATPTPTSVPAPAAEQQTTTPLETAMTTAATATATPTLDPAPSATTEEISWQEAGAAGPLPPPTKAVPRPDPSPRSTPGPSPSPNPNPEPTPAPETATNWVDLRRPDPNAPSWATPPASAPAAPAPARWTASPGEESRRWAMGAHISAIAGGFMGGIPAFLGPLVVWLLRKDRDGFAAGHGRNALNFNLSMIAYAVALILFSVVTFGLGVVVAAPLGGILGILWLVFSILGAVRAANDQPFRYPLTIPFVR